jgi:hypothetical protein
VRFTIPPAYVDNPLLVDPLVGLPQLIANESVILPVALFQDHNIFTGQRDRHLALKSEETPLETLRRIPGFVEAGR